MADVHAERRVRVAVRLPQRGAGVGGPGQPCRPRRASSGCRHQIQAPASGAVRGDILLS